MYMLAHLIEDREQLRLLITIVLLLQVRKKAFWRHSIQQTERLACFLIADSRQHSHADTSNAMLGPGQSQTTEGRHQLAVVPLINPADSAGAGGPERTSR